MAGRHHLTDVAHTYFDSVRGAAVRTVDQLFASSSDVCSTFRQAASFFESPSAGHPAARQAPALQHVAEELATFSPAARAEFARSMLQYMRYHYGYQAASADYTTRLERLLANMQERQMRRMGAGDTAYD